MNDTIDPSTSSRSTGRENITTSSYCSLLCLPFQMKPMWTHLHLVSHTSEIWMMIVIINCTKYDSTALFLLHPESPQGHSLAVKRAPISCSHIHHYSGDLRKDPSWICIPNTRPTSRAHLSGDWVQLYFMESSCSPVLSVRLRASFRTPAGLLTCSNTLNMWLLPSRCVSRRGQSPAFHFRWVLDLQDIGSDKESICMIVRLYFYCWRMTEQKRHNCQCC